jgi:hypothetical protein
MTYVDQQNTTTTTITASNYEQVIDSSLDFYSAQLKNYPVANAFDYS